MNDSTPDSSLQSQDQIIGAERESINERRRAAGLPEAQADDLVGIALSGGGIRSAVYNLGFLQALSHRGLFRHVDYLCSVSGGGYIAGHIAALATRWADHRDQLISNQVATQEKPHSTWVNTQVVQSEADRIPHFHDAIVTNDGKSERVAHLGVGRQGQLLSNYKFRFVGEYLISLPWQFVWRYVAYTLPMAALFVSALAVPATLCALLWRLLDLEYSREVLRLLGVQDVGISLYLGDETLIAFLPCLLPLSLFALLLVLRVICKLFGWRPPWGSESFSAWALICLGVFLGVSLAVFLGNGETQLGMSSELIQIQSYLNWPIFLLTILFLLPMLRFRSVVNSSREGAPPWQAWAGRTIVGGACLLMPFYIVHWMAKENISGFATYRDATLIRNDILDWPAFFRFVEELEALGDPAIHVSNVKVLSKLKEVADHEKQLFPDSFDSPWKRHRDLPLVTLSGTLRRLKLIFWNWNGIRDHLDRVIDCYTPMDNSIQPLNLQLSDPKLTQRLQSYYFRLAAEAGATNSPADRLTHEVLNESYEERIKNMHRREADDLRAYWERTRFAEKDQSAYLAKLDTLGWQPSEIAAFNRLLLEFLQPKIFRDRTMVSTLIVPVEDQWTRVRWLCVWSGLLLICVCLNVNELSPFYFYYRERLRQRFLAIADPRVREARTDAPIDLMLRDVKPWTTGAPYPIFLSSVFLLDRISPSRDPMGRDAQDSSQVNAFVFTPKYTGSAFTGYAKTSDYYGGRITLADAMALSGAAVTPFMTNNLGLWAMMAALNLRIGQWLPHPRNANWLRISPCRILSEAWNAFRTPRWQSTAHIRTNQGYGLAWRIGLVADGGFHEFFGLEELLLRRCRLIIVSDAGCNNGKFEFGALADTIRLIRLRHGIEFYDLDHDRPADMERIRRQGNENRQNMHHLCLRIRYPEGRQPQEAFLIYCQMSLTGDEDLDLQQFRNINSSFPDEPTTNQFYNEGQVESFRQLGFHVGDVMCRSVPQALGNATEEVFKHLTTEEWIAKLRRSYAVECDRTCPTSQATTPSLPKRTGYEQNRIGLEIDQSKIAPIYQKLLGEAEDAVRLYLSDAAVREEWRSIADCLAQDASRRPKVTIPSLSSKNVAYALLAWQDLASTHCETERPTFFVVGGRQRLCELAVWLGETLVSRQSKPCLRLAQELRDRQIFLKGQLGMATLAVAGCMRWRCESGSSVLKYDRAWAIATMIEKREWEVLNAVLYGDD